MSFLFFSSRSRYIYSIYLVPSGECMKNYFINKSHDRNTNADMRIHWRNIECDIVWIVRRRPRDEKRERDSVLLRKRQHEQDLLQSGGNGRTDCSGPLANSAAINSNVTEPLIGARQQRHPVKVNGNDYEHIWQSSGLILASSAPYEVERGPNLCQTFKPDIQAQLPPAPRVPDSPIRETIIGRDGCCANRGNQFDYYLYSTGRTALTDVWTDDRILYIYVEFHCGLQPIRK